MPIYNFQKQFAPLILDGSKPHTIRRRRRRTVVGDTLYLYTGLRTKECQLIGRAPCVKVTPLCIYVYDLLVKMDGRILSLGQTVALAKADGFRNMLSFFQFFERYGEAVLDDFELVEWDPKKLETPLPSPQIPAGERRIFGEETNGDD